MIRVRSVHPDIWTDGRFVSLSPEARLLAIRLWSQAAGPGIVPYVNGIDDLIACDLVRVVGHGMFCSRHLGRPRLPWPSDGSVNRHVGYLISKPQARSCFARSLGVSLTVWRKLRSAVFKRDGYACSYCARTDLPIECDHITAVSRGGLTVMENLTAACRPCNRKKGSKSLAEWRPA